MMRSEVLEEPAFGQPDQIYNTRMELIKRRSKHGLIAILMFVLLAIGIAYYRYHITKDIVLDGRFYQNIGQLQPTQDQTPAEEGALAVSQKELGTMAWTILHMSTGMFPFEFAPTLAEKFNTFLLLFGELYPCKQCGSFFLKSIKELGPFAGQTKEEIMIYLCRVHNRINEELGKPLHDCSAVKEEWNSCGCEEE